MIVSGYYGEIVVTGDLTPRWVCWFVSMAFFLDIVHELLVGLATATASEADPVIASRIGPIVYLKAALCRHSAGYDSDQVVHIPNCVLVPNVSWRS